MEQNEKDTKSAQSMRKTMRSVRYMQNFVWKSPGGKAYTLLKLLEAVLNTLLPFTYIIFPGLLINELSGERRMLFLLLYVTLIVGLPFAGNLLQTGIGKKLYQLEMDLTLHFDLTIYEQMAKMEYEVLENPDVQVKKRRSKDTIEQSLEVIGYICELCSSCLGLAAVVSTIFILHPLFILLVVVSTYIHSIFLKRSNAKEYAYSREISLNDHHIDPYYYTLDELDYAQELRIFHLSDFLLHGYKKLKKEGNTLHLQQNANERKCDILISICNLVQQVVMYAYILYEVLQNGLPIGSMSIYMGITAQFSDSLNGITGAYLDLARMSLYVQELMDFLHMPVRSTAGKKKPVFDSHSVLEFRDVSFRYPGNERYALKHMNISIRGGEKLSIVGENGAGKSTFIKLMTRLYLPTEGTILLNGVDIQEYDYDQYQRLFAPVLQDFQIYDMLPLGKNITLTEPDNPSLLDRVCRQCGLSALLAKLPKGYDTIPSKYVDENGFEPSGGEGQRMAIARACYRGSDIFILDEPTAALDPNAEYEIYTQFSRMITGKCAVLITHRLSAVQLADRVAVFSNGGLAEYGTHAELYAKGGMYTEMFDKQAQFYRDNPQGKEAAEASV